MDAENSVSNSMNPAAKELSSSSSVQREKASVPEKNMPHYVVPTTSMVGDFFTLVLLVALIVARVKRSLRWSVLAIGWSVSFGLYALAVLACTIESYSEEVALVSGVNTKVFIEGIYVALLFHKWMLFVSAAGVALGTGLVAWYWPQDKRV